MTYKVLPLWQPWAQLCVIGAKKFETRSRDTKVRGTVLIHACKRWTNALQKIRGAEPFYTPMMNHLNSLTFGEVMNSMDMPLGCIIGAVDIVATQVVDAIGSEACYIGGKGSFIWEESLGKDCAHLAGNGSKIWIKSPEYLFGDYTPGRFAWKLENPRILAEPLPFKGTQGWGKYETDKPLIFKL